MLCRIFVALLALASSAQVAEAQLASTDLSTTIDNSSAPCIVANAKRKTLYLENPVTNSYNIGYCIGSGCTASIGTAGTSVLVPGAADYWPLYAAPPEALDCIAGSSSIPLTARSAQ